MKMHCCVGRAGKLVTSSVSTFPPLTLQLYTVHSNRDDHDKNTQMEALRGRLSSTDKSESPWLLVTKESLCVYGLAGSANYRRSSVDSPLHRILSKVGRRGFTQLAAAVNAYAHIVSNCTFRTICASVLKLCVETCSGKGREPAACECAI